MEEGGTELRFCRRRPTRRRREEWTRRRKKKREKLTVPFASSQDPTTAAVSDELGGGTGEGRTVRDLERLPPVRSRSNRRQSSLEVPNHATLSCPS